MSKILSIFLSFFLFLLAFSTTALAQEVPQAKTGVDFETAINTLSPVRWLPDHPLYFLITLKENLQTTFQPNSERKAEWQMILSGKRLKEAYLLIQKNKINQAANALAKYEEKIGQATREIDKAKGEGRDTARLIELLSDNLRRHEAVLDGVITKAPESARAGLTRAIEVSSRGLQKAIEAVQKVKPTPKPTEKQEATPSPQVTPSEKKPATPPGKIK